MWYPLLPCLSGLLSSFLTPSRVFLLQQSWKSKVSTHLTNPAAFIIPIVILCKNTPHLLSVLVFEARGEECGNSRDGVGWRGALPRMLAPSPPAKTEAEAPFLPAVAVELLSQGSQPPVFSTLTRDKSPRGVIFERCLSNVVL